MALSARKVENRLLAHHLFPRIAKRGDEFPPCFVSTSFTSNIASKLLALSADRPDGYGVITLRSTRYDLAPRNMEVLHPRAFAKLVRQLRVTWDDWKHIETNLSSALRLAEHADGRIFSMVEQGSAEDLVVPGSRFRARADVTNFYGSIYTHAIPWAVHGVETAKARQEDGADWANRLDIELRQARRKETTGISIGPGTSAIVGEIMLGSVDERLRHRGHDFRRFIDDYFFVGSSRDEAEAFVRDLRDALAVLKLTVHPGKTKITELPIPVRPRWMRELRIALREGNTAGKLLDLIDQAIESQEGADEDGALRFALVTIENALALDSVEDAVRIEVADRLLTIGFLRPIAMGTVCRILMQVGSGAVSERAKALNQILREHISNRRTDAATWIIYLLLVNQVEVDGVSVEEIVRSGDCLPIALLTCATKYLPTVKGFVTSFEKRQPPAYMRDEYWLVYYQLALANLKSKNVPADYYAEFQPLLDASVSFIDLGAENPYRPILKAPGRAPISGIGGAGGRNPYAD